jgi:hypothetical protein
MAPANPAIELFSTEDLRSAGALKRRYHELLKLYHPDRQAGKAEWANGTVRAIIAAYHTLKPSVGTAGAPPRPFADMAGKPVDLRQVLRSGDDALRRAVSLGWLRRVPRQPRDRDLRARIEAARDALLADRGEGRRPVWAGFYGRLFDAFLETTGAGAPLPYTWSAPGAFRDLRSANALLERGIRDYYHHRERDRLGALGAVALSCLGDASRFYSCISRRLEPGPVKEVAQSRIAIAKAFQERIRSRALLDIV